MTAGSFDLPPIQGKAIHQGIDHLVGVLMRAVSQMGIAGGGEDTGVAEDFLHFQQIDTGFDQMRGVAMAQAVRGNLFFRPQSCATWRSVVCTPARSNGVVAKWADLRPPWRLGNSRTGLRCTCQKRRRQVNVDAGNGTKRLATGM
jgi:hypothetical protein